MRRVLIDNYGNPVRMNVVEGAEGGKLVVEGKIGQCDHPTANNRVYPRPVMEREIARLQPRIAQGSVIGAVDHPGDGKSRIREAGCIVRKLWIEDNGQINGRFEVVEEADAGRNIAAFLRRGAAIGMSSRGMGSTSLAPTGHDMVGEDFRLNTWDFVADPACSDAYPSVISEDVDAEGVPTGKIVIPADGLTEMELRTKFPKLVEGIENHAMWIAQETVSEDVEASIRAQVEGEVGEGVVAARDKIREEIKEEVYEEVRKEMAEDYAVKLVRALAELRGDVMEEVRSEINSDPAQATATATLKRMAEMINPFSPDDATARVLGEKDAEVAALREAVNTQENAVKRANHRAAQLEAKGKELAYQVFVERELQGRLDAGKLREAIGDVTAYSTAVALKEKVDALLSHADEITVESNEAAHAAFAEEREELTERVKHAEAAARQAQVREKSLRKDVNKRLNQMEGQISEVVADRDHKVRHMTEQVEEAHNVAGQAELLAYTARRTVGLHGQSEIMEAVMAGKILTEDDVDSAASRSEGAASRAGNTGYTERVRRAMGRGQEHLAEGEHNPQPAGSNQGGRHGGDYLAESEADSDLAILGLTMGQQKQSGGTRSGMRR
jgi:hypothetical protein